MYEPVEVANLAEGQHAFQVADGDVVAVEITQREIPEAENNVVREHHVALKVRAWKVEPTDGSASKGPDGRVLEIPVRMESIVSSALAEGVVNIQDKLVEYTVAALDRAKTWLTVKRHMERIPKSSF